MAGPAGETCGTCYYFDEGRCKVQAQQLTRTINPASVAGYSQGAPLWPRTSSEQWCGEWVDSGQTPTGSTATGAFVTPSGTSFNVTDTTNWVKYDPGNLLEGAIMRNMTLTNGTLDWNIPQSTDEWEAVVSLYGSVTFPTANTFLEVAPGTAGVPYSDNTVQRLSVNPQTDDLSLTFSLQGVAPGAQTGSAELLMRGNIGNASYRSCVLQVRVRRLT